MPAIDRPRRVAYDVVLAVDTKDAYANLLLPRVLRDAGLDERDAAFATELTYGALRWQGVLDEVVAAAARRPVAALDPPVRALVRIGAYQLLHMRTPPHAAVHATVELTRSLAGPRPVGFVNAVLRKVSQLGWEQWVDRLAPDDRLGRLAFRQGHPRWVADALLDALGGDLDELAAALVPDRPVTHLVARPGRISRDELLAQAGPGATAGPWSPLAVRMGAGDPSSLPAVRDRRAGVQDEGSQLVALALAGAQLTGPDRRWLDVCAGPGGKSVLLEGSLPPDAVLLSADLQPHRARLVAGVRDNVGGVVVADGRRPAWPPHRFDRVLVDAPCTGLGALRRRPEVRWRRRPEDVAALAELQTELLVAALDATRPGGLVAYVTCSPHLAETRRVVASALVQRPAVRPLDARRALADVPDLGPGPDVQLWPHRHGTDAMYLALLRPGDR